MENEIKTKKIYYIKVNYKPNEENNEKVKILSNLFVVNNKKSVK